MTRATSTGRNPASRAAAAGPWRTPTTASTSTCCPRSRTSSTRPPSILTTPRAAGAYGGEPDLSTATRTARAGMSEHIENRHGIWWVPNPAHEEENFADKWNEYPERREAFIAWHRDVTGVL